jgi:inosose dehydratase
MTKVLNRRGFSQAILGFAGAMVLPGAVSRKLKIGHTCITWGTFPNSSTSPTLETALKDIGGLGFYGFETFPENLADWDGKGELKGLIEKNRVPLISAYIRVNLTDPAAHKDNLAEITKQAKLVKKYGGRFGVLGPNGVKRDSFDFKANRASIVSALNDCAMAVTDAGLECGLHQHTGTCIETRDETYSVMESANTKYVKFAPDVGQLQKGGADAAKVVQDFLPQIRHVHLKDFDGGEHFLGYCPLGKGKVDIQRILDLVEGAKHTVNVMVELDPSPKQPMTALETAQIASAYLKNLGYKFRT